MGSGLYPCVYCGKWDMKSNWNKVSYFRKCKACGLREKINKRGDEKTLLESNRHELSDEIAKSEDALEFPYPWEEGKKPEGVSA